MRVVLAAQIPSAVEGLTRLLQAMGHEPVALLCTREHADRFGGAFEELCGRSLQMRSPSRVSAR
jgi:hypothetical protein